VPAWVKVLIYEWLTAANITSGSVFRAMRKGGALRKAEGLWQGAMDDSAIWQLVRAYPMQALPHRRGGIAPHDLRRTCAHFCRESNGKLEQIQALLGHSSIATTERYLGTVQKLDYALNDSWSL